MIARSERCAIPLDQVIGRNAFDVDRMLEIDPDFLKHFHHHDHDDHVSSFSLTSDAPLDPDRFFPWIQSISQHFGLDLLRMKGIIAFEGDNERYVMQGIHMLVEGDHQRPWKPDEARVTRIVFIGRDLPRDIFADGFERCIAKSKVLA